MSKLSLVAALVLGGLVAGSTLATAQDSNAPKKKGRMNIEQQMERMTEALTLTDDQKPKVKAALEETNKKRQAIMSDTSIERSQMREKMQPITEEQNKKMKEILTADQFKKYQEMRQQGKKGGKKKDESK
jgi:acyl-CoA reductase-like NAD-dependent aldehyde dehydrogenase